MASPKYTFKSLPEVIQNLYLNSPKTGCSLIQAAFFRSFGHTPARINMEATSVAELSKSLSKAVEASGSNHQNITRIILRSAGMCISNQLEPQWVNIPHGGPGATCHTSIGELTASDWNICVDVSYTNSTIQALEENASIEDGEQITCETLLHHYGIARWLPLYNDRQINRVTQITHRETNRFLEAVFIHPEATGPKAAKLKQELYDSRCSIILAKRDQLTRTLGEIAGLPDGVHEDNDETDETDETEYDETEYDEEGDV